jgi:hypothetical protein
MKHILIVGCSWASGVWSDDEYKFRLIDQGITSLFENQGYRVINLSQPGSDPWGVLWPLDCFLLCNKHLDIDKIYYIQTDIGRSFSTRDLPPIKEFQKNIYNTVLSMYDQLYQELDAIALKHNKLISVIGGLTDVVVSLKEYNNLYLEVPSWCRLVDPSVSLTALLNESAFDYLSKIPSISKLEMSNLLQLANDRYEFYNNNTQWFWPDGLHPNLNLHNLLFEKLIKNIASQ